MKVFVVSATPEPNSFVASMAKASVDVMRGLGHDVVHSDLYAMGWNPVASAADFDTRRNPEYLTYALEQRHNVEAGSLAPDIRAELDKLQDADLLIFNFPVYWFSTPAILKGWIDRVLVSGLCYGGRRIYNAGGMVGKRAFVGLTLGGREDMFGEGAIHGPIKQLLRPVLQGTLAYVGYEVLEPFIGWHIPYLKPEEREAIMDRYIESLKTLDLRPALVMPSWKISMRT
ncbi:NAD(P)H-dependent oxidoreductase [Ochrobactrum daejeonense]|nr:NAD(P)H-dependent oxidoreductase [Brucella daejeonensis]